jgi:hypothetical protein
LGFDSPCSMGERTSWPVGLTFFSGPIVLHFNVCFTNNFWSRFHVWCLKSSFFFYVVGPHELVNFPLRRTSPFFLVNIPLFYPFFKYLFDGSEKMSTSDRSNWKWWSIDWRISKTVFFQFMKDGSNGPRDGSNSVQQVESLRVMTYLLMIKSLFNPHDIQFSMVNS